MANSIEGYRLRLSSKCRAVTCLSFHSKYLLILRGGYFLQGTKSYGFHPF